jgi:hypothetical protein
LTALSCPWSCRRSAIHLPPRCLFCLTPGRRVPTSSAQHCASVTSRF